ADGDDLACRAAAPVEAACRDLRTADARLRRRDLRDRFELAGAVLARDHLVDHRARRVPRPGDELRADTIRVDGSRGEGGDRVLVEVARHRDAGRGRAERVELLAHLERLRAEIARVEPDGAET